MFRPNLFSMWPENVTLQQLFFLEYISALHYMIFSVETTGWIHFALHYIILTATLRLHLVFGYPALHYNFWKVITYFMAPAWCINVGPQAKCVSLATMYNVGVALEIFSGGVKCEMFTLPGCSVGMFSSTLFLFISVVFMVWCNWRRFIITTMM